LLLAVTTILSGTLMPALAGSKVRPSMRLSHPSARGIIFLCSLPKILSELRGTVSFPEIPPIPLLTKGG
jgi:hypothetical protein